MEAAGPTLPTATVIGQKAGLWPRKLDKLLPSLQTQAPGQLSAHTGGEGPASCHAQLHTQAGRWADCAVSKITRACMINA